MSHKIPAAFILGIGIALAGYFVGSAINNFRLVDRFVTVKGLAETTVTADTGIWTLQFNNAADQLPALYNQVNDAQTKLITFLKAQGFQDSEIQIQPVSITDNASNSYNSNQKAKRYSAQGGVVLTTHNIPQLLKAQQTVSTLVEGGVAVSSASVRYIYTQLNKIKPTMLTEATDAAKAAGETFAHNSESTLGTIHSASQGLFTVANADGSYGDSDPDKIVRVVTTVEYQLR